MAHGVANAILLPTVEKYNMISNPQKFAEIDEFIGKNITGMSTHEATEKQFKQWKHYPLSIDVGISISLEVISAKKSDFELMAENALKDRNTCSNSRQGTKKKIIALLTQAFSSSLPHLTIKKNTSE